MPGPDSSMLFDVPDAALAAARRAKCERAVERLGAAADGEAAEAIAWTRRSLDAASQASRDAVWCAPDAYFRVRLAAELERAVEAGEARGALAAAAVAAQCDDVAQARDRALASLQWLGLAVHAIEETDADLPVALRLRRASPVPGTALCVDRPSGSDPVDVHGVRDGSPVDGDGASCSSSRAPVVEVGHARVIMQPSMFMVPGFVQGLPDIAFQRDHAELLRKTLSRIQAIAPSQFDDVASSMHVVALKGYDDSDFVNQSHSHFPGAAMLSVVDHADELADKLIHEWAHNRLFGIEESGALLDGREATSAERYYSPWRDDKRALRGILHAVFVHIHVMPYWLACVEQGALAGEEHRFACDRLARYALQLRIGLGQLDRFAAWTERGRAFRAWAAARIDQLDAARQAAGVTDEAAARIVRVDGTIHPERRLDVTYATVRDAVEAHAVHCDGVAALDVIAG